ncbi:hypothetical protein GCM10010149_18760 [Nonomuraea roseoviolacea subsp. roseoviolacea]|uniref:nSTAND1 domain-containing NTPase n=1 Tax=Nonomuraea roseoviolacea TaxID=103837 RepID=UPI0031D4D5CA
MPRPERPLDAGDSPLLRFAADLRALRRKAGDPTYRRLARLAHYSAATLSEAAAGRRLPTLPVTLAYVRACGGDEAEWEQRWRRISEERAEPVDDGAAPYVGLASFQAEDAARFFGRERVTGELLRRVTEQRIVMVFGASGAGKSSLLRAGLLAAVQERGRPAPAVSGRAGDRPWRALLFTPGAHPLEECAIHLARLSGGTPGPLRDELAADPRALHRLTRQFLGDEPPGTELLVIVDQFEEVFTLCHDEEERARFVGLLLTAARADGSRCRLVLGVRADFYAHCTSHPALLEALREAHLPLGPMTADELRRAVVQPAVRAGCIVEGALAARIVADAAGQPGALPLVSHALLETWHRRRGTTLTLAGYEAAGGLSQAVARTAEDAYTALDPSRRELARQTLLRLTALGEGTQDTKRRIRRHQLDDDPATGAVLEHLARARLVTLGRDSVEISHEALIGSWPRLRDWLAEDREGLRVHHRLAEATEAWAALGRDPGSLYRGTALALASEWAGRHDAALTAREREFLSAGMAAEAREAIVARRRTRRLRLLVALLSVLLVVAGTATGYAVAAQEAATGQRDIALSQRVADQAIGLRAVNPPLAAQLSLAADRLAPTLEARGSLLGAFTTPFTTRLDHEINTVAFTPGGRVIATGGDDRTLRLWDLAIPHRPRLTAEVPGLSDDVETLRFSPDGTLLAGVLYDGVLRLWRVAGGALRPVATVAASPKALFGLAFHPDGRSLATGGDDGVLRVWDLADPRTPRVVTTAAAHPAQAAGAGAPPAHATTAAAHPAGVITAAVHPGGLITAAVPPARVTAVAFLPGGLVTSGDDGTAALWRLTGDHRARLLSRVRHGDGSLTSAAVSPDGRTLATAGWDHVTRLWDVRDPRRPVPLSRLTGHSGPLQAVTFSPDGRTLATAGWDHTTRLWNVARPRTPLLVTTLTAHANTVWSLTFSPDGRLLASASSDHSALLTDLPGPVLSTGDSAVSTAAFSPGGRTVAVGGEDFTTRLWDVADPYHPRPLPLLTGHTGQVESVAFSPDGGLLATGSIDGTVRLWGVADPARPRPVAVFRAHAEGIRSIAFRPGGAAALLATASPSDPVVRLWNLADPGRPRPAGALPSQGDGTLSVAFSPDGRTLATSLLDAAVLWDVTDPGRPARLGSTGEHGDAVQAVAFAPGGRTLATAGLDRTVRLWDVTRGRAPAPLAVLSGHTDAVRGLAYAPDGRTLATASLDRTVRLWDVTRGRAPAPLAVLSGHADRVYSVAYGPDGHTLVSTSEDRSARLWRDDLGGVAARVCELARPRITRAEWAQYFADLPYQPPCP